MLYFVTWRLADAWPKAKLEAWAAEKKAWLARHPKPWSQEDAKEYHQKFSETIDAWLDAGSGSCLLRDPDCRRIVCGAFAYFEGQRYELESFVVMPNDVHILFRLTGTHSLESVLHSWKSFTSKELKRLTRQGGTIWQEDYWDRMIRNEQHLAACLRYIRENPVKAGQRPDEYTLYERGTGVSPV